MVLPQFITYGHGYSVVFMDCSFLLHAPAVAVSLHYTHYHFCSLYAYSHLYNAHLPCLQEDSTTGTAIHISASFLPTYCLPFVGQVTSLPLDHLTIFILMVPPRTLLRLLPLYGSPAIPTSPRHYLPGFHEFWAVPLPRFTATTNSPRHTTICHGLVCIQLRAAASAAYATTASHTSVAASLKKAGEGGG